MDAQVARSLPQSRRREYNRPRGALSPKLTVVDRISAGNMQELQDDYYLILGVEETATADDVRKAYLKLAKKLHPDRFPNDPEKKAEAQQQFSKVSRAHDVLGDPKQREEYDALRMLARNRASLDTGAPGATLAGGVNPAVSQQLSASKVESKENWAAKHSDRAKECMERKRFQDAETAIKEAIRLDPNKTKYHIQLAEIYVARGWKTLALTEVQTVLRINPQDGEAKQLELKLKANQKAATAAADKEKKGSGFLDSISKLLGKK
jgi:curved DNA-binding protein CbpA